MLSNWIFTAYNITHAIFKKEQRWDLNNKYMIKTKISKYRMNEQK